ncbi:MAG: sulfotransferase family 2 domain-containing protein [Methylococcales bacterium]|nr:sulfotransferase family 2 domain-containing protein [Methylococcales bacterium]
MLISYDRKFIFFHVAKVAGLSLREALAPYTTEPEKFKIRRPIKLIDGKLNPLYSIWESTVIHATALSTQKELGEADFEQYFKFAFVRNPWDWQVSMYHFILKETAHAHHQRVKALAGFSDYVKWMIAEKKPFEKGATRYQKDMICNKQGEVIVDFVGRFENLADDFNYVSQYLGLEASIPYLNQSHHRPYQSYYDSETYELIAEHFKDDIALLGYEFEAYHNTADYLQRKFPGHAKTN